VLQEHITILKSTTIVVFKSYEDAEIAAKYDDKNIKAYYLMA